MVVAASTSAWDDEDVFYEGGGEGAGGGEGDAGGGRCVGCGARGRADFLCGSDNRTYSSLCRLDLHNCVRRPLRPVRLVCRGFCPCRPHRASRPRARRPTDDDVSASTFALSLPPPHNRLKYADVPGLEA